MSPQATSADPGRVGAWKIDPGTVELIDLSFKRLDIVLDKKDVGEAGVAFDFNALRPAPDQVAVMLSLEVVEPDVAVIQVQAGTILTVTFPEIPPENTEEALADMAAQIGPVVIYPYLRELVADLTRRAGFKALTLPIYQIGSYFSIDPVTLKLEAASETPSDEPVGKKAVKKSGGKRVVKKRKPASRSKP